MAYRVLTSRFVYRGGAPVAAVGARGDRVAGDGAQQRRGAADVTARGAPLRPRARRVHAGARADRACPRARPRLRTRTFQAPHH